AALGVDLGFAIADSDDGVLEHIEIDADKPLEIVLDIREGQRVGPDIDTSIETDDIAEAECPVATQGKAVAVVAIEIGVIGLDAHLAGDFTAITVDEKTATQQIDIGVAVVQPAAGDGGVAVADKRGIACLNDVIPQSQLEA